MLESVHIFRHVWKVGLSSAGVVSDAKGIKVPLYKRNTNLLFDLLPRALILLVR